METIDYKYKGLRFELHINEGRRKTTSEKDPICKTMLANLLVRLLLTVLTFVVETDAHGYLLNPPSRSSVWRNRQYGSAPINNDDNGLNCGGWSNQHETNNGKCGVCGDPYQGPRDNEAGGKYATGIITQRYKEGQKMSVEVRITVNHGGWFEFRICPNNNPKRPATEECLSQNLLKRPDGSTKFQIHSKDGARMYTVELQLPRGLTCTQCVLQWKWTTGNFWGCETQDGHQQCGMGFGPQENFMGCADVAVSGSSDLTSVPAVTTKPTIDQTSHINNQAVHTTGCQATGAWRAIYLLADQWCQNNCPYNCPSQCERSCHTTTSANVNNGNSNNVIRPGNGVAPTVQTLECVATPLWKGMYINADNWCKTNCARNICPSNYCGSGCRVYRKIPIFG